MHTNVPRPTSSCTNPPNIHSINILIEKWYQVLWENMLVKAVCQPVLEKVLSPSHKKCRRINWPSLKLLFSFAVLTSNGYNTLTFVASMSFLPNGSSCSRKWEPRCPSLHIRNTTELRTKRQSIVKFGSNRAYSRSWPVRGGLTQCHEYILKVLHATAIGVRIPVDKIMDRAGIRNAENRLREYAYGARRQYCTCRRFSSGPIVKATQYEL